MRVVIVDDSAFMRTIIGRLLKDDPDFEVVGYAGDGAEGVTKVAELRPDVVTMDVEMPVMNGIEAVEAIMRATPTPVVMLSSMTLRGAAITIEALTKGAIDFVSKPSGGSAAELGSVAEELKDKLRRAARLSSTRLAAVRVPMPVPPPSDRSAPGAALGGLSRRSRKVVAIGTSTGGPAALTQLIPRLPADLPAGVLLVQHMPAGFTKALAQRLDAVSSLTVREAVAGELVQDGTALVAPGDFHMAVDGSGHITLSQEPPVHSVRPSADVLLTSVARMYGRSAVGVVLTGMGHDGGAGATEVKRAGGRVLVQDEASSVVYGMAATVVEAGSADAVLPLTEMAERIVDACR
jgi:two-component system chemotaxis response regulator CheB